MQPQAQHNCILFYTSRAKFRNLVDDKIAERRHGQKIACIVIGSVLKTDAVKGESSISLQQPHPNHEKSALYKL